MIKNSELYNKNFFYIILAAFLIEFSWLSPFQTYPWVSFFGEFASFCSALSIFSLFLNKKIIIPKIQLYMLPIVFTPLLQWVVGLITEFGHAWLVFNYLYIFWIMIIIGFNLSLKLESREKAMDGICILFLFGAIISSIFAIVQWLNLEELVTGVIPLAGNRPYANFAQPNNLATFLVLGLMGALYFYEKGKRSFLLIIPSSFLIIFTICLTQSRTSWIICFFLYFYWIYKYKKNQARLKFKKLLLWCLMFLLLSLYIIPTLNIFLININIINKINNIDISSRVSSGYERIEIWLQLLHAIIERPWIGYGWNQTGVAWVESLQWNTIPVWFNSAHNLFLDIVIWNGIPIGIIIIFSMTAWLLWLNNRATDIISIIGLMMIGSIIIHSMLEFPQNYAYFLLPTGFLLGVVQAHTPHLKGLLVSNKIIQYCWLIIFLIIFLTWRDYKVFQEKLLVAFDPPHQNNEVSENSNILLLTQLDTQIDWIHLNPETILSNDELNKIGKMVKNKASPYNLNKYAKLLAYNKKTTEVEEQLFILKKLYQK